MVEGPVCLKCLSTALGAAIDQRECHQCTENELNEISISSSWMMWKTVRSKDIPLWEFLVMRSIEHFDPLVGHLLST